MVHMSGGARIHCLVAVQCELLHTNPISLRCNIVWKVWLELQEDLVIELCQTSHSKPELHGKRR